MKNEFYVEIVSDLDFEELVADICWGENTVATISQEEGPENMQVEIFSPERDGDWTFPLSKFLRTLAFARQKLNEMRRE